MSHRVTIKTQMRDLDALRAACVAKGLTCQVGPQTVTVFATKVQCNFSVKLPDWVFPVCVDTKTGEVHYDNYGGSWGDINALHDFTQEYSLMLAEREAQELMLQGWTVERVKQENGDVQLVLQQG